MRGVLLSIVFFATSVVSQNGFPRNFYNYNPTSNPIPYYQNVIPVNPDGNVHYIHESSVFMVDSNPTQDQLKDRHKTNVTVNQIQVAVVLPPGYKIPTYSAKDPAHQNGIWVQLPGYVHYPSQTPSPLQQDDENVQTPVPSATAPVPQTWIITSKPKNPLLSKCLRPRGQFPSDYCNTFINCWDDTAVEQFCPIDLVFNPAGFCDYPYNYYCNKPTKPEEVRPTPPGPGPAYPGDGSWYPHPPPVITAPPHPPYPQYPVTGPPAPVTGPPYPQYPVTGTPTPVTPPPITGTRPPPTLSPPLPPPVTADPVPELPQLTPAEIALLKRKCLKPRGQFPTDACHKFVNCWDDWVSEQECDAGLLFNPLGFCDYPQNVNCNNRTTLPPGQSECPIAYGTFRNATNCNSAFTCSANVVVSRFECPPGYNYNDQLGVCDFIHNVNCGSSGKHNSNYQPPPMQQFDRAFVEGLCHTGNLARLSNDCSRVAFCRNGVPEVVACNPGLGYDAQSDRCVTSQYARC